MITRHIADLLFHHECVIVPGLGGFIKAQRSARIVVETHEFYPPSSGLAFNSGLSGSDGILANYIATTQNTSYREAVYEIKVWVDACLENLKQGNPVIIDGIGELKLNSSGKIEYIASNLSNFNADSFGLPVFQAKVASNSEFVLPEIEPSKPTHRNLKLRRLIPETLKWAAVLAPFIAFALWGTLKGNIIDNYVHNYSGMYSWVRSTPGKKAPVNIAAYPVLPKKNHIQVNQPNNETFTRENISFNPGLVSYTELAKCNLVIKDTTQSMNGKSQQPEKNFHIIGGAFRDRNNALKLIEMLSEKGYTAAIVDTTSGGMYIVSMFGFDTYSEAQIKLKEIKKEGFEASWIMKKHKS